MRRATAIFLPLAIVAAAVLYLIYRAQSATLTSLALARDETGVEMARLEIRAEIGAVTARARYLSEQETLRYWLAHGDSVTRSILEANYVALVRSAAIFDQLRFIDENGRERIRIDWSRGQPRAVPEAALQGKVDRYYVSATLALARGRVYVSPFDLNVDHGAIEQPINPTIRVAAPVYDDGGQRRGLVVLNYRGQGLIDRLRELPTGRRLRLLNADGYWLMGPTEADEWAFMYPDRRDRTFARAHPEAWRRLRGGGPSDQFFLAGDAYSYAKVPPQGVGALPWIVLAVLPAAELSALSAGLRFDLVAAFAGLAVLFAGGSWIVASQWHARNEIEQAIRHNEARFRGLLESAPDAVVVTDREGRIQMVNAETERMFGYRRDELLGRFVEMLVPARLRTGHGDHRVRYTAAPRPRAMGSGLALTGQRKNGSEVPVAVSLSPAMSNAGMLVFCDIRDVTEQRRAEEQIRDLNTRLARDNAELGALNNELEAFSYSVSHDLRAPLRAIDGFSQALVEDYAERLDDAGKDYAGRVRNAAQRMGLLIDDLLKLARVARADLAADEVDLSALAADVAASLAKTAPARSVDFVIAPGLKTRGDERLLRIALENLLGNSWKFTAGMSAARIEFGAQLVESGPAYYVRDNGVGFDMAYAGKLFGAFQRLHDGREFPGTGIGLATVQRIIHKHGGRVWAAAAVGKGATFFFTL